ncbi:PASTA domain-containing protein [Nocardioides pelophilus]|uniref:PASTA domain-containing protein n=1 Tax=Nocardioides pelophilus TaxID=2172019 RepID=UPI0015FEF5C5|nr:PASTA domain-containing protein [Nocardioides pelophilus]
MPTEDPAEAQARSLLARAAGTIEVDESAPMTLSGLPEPRTRRWPVLAAAAAVVLAIGGGLLVSQQLGDDPQPAPVSEPTAVADREPVEQEHVYADDELPSLLGYTEEEATDLLSDRGYSLRVEAEYSCDQPRGYVLGTDPGPGTSMAPGDRVRLRVTAGPSPAVRCAVAPDTWQQVLDLVRFARGLAPAPDVPDGLSIAVGEGQYADLSAEQAADPQRWVLCDGGECHSALAALEMILTRPVGMDGFFAHTFLAVTDALMPAFNGPDPMCVTPDPLAGLDILKYHPTTYVYVDHPTDGVWLCPPPPVVQIEWTKDHRIADVRLRLAAEADPLDTEELELSLDRASAAERFVAWARGEGPAPEFADRVRVMFSGGGAFGHTGWTDEPESRTSYSGCSGLGFPDCGIDPVALLVRYRGPVVPTAGPLPRARGPHSRPLDLRRRR